jgi:hypothetical protein
MFGLRTVALLGLIVFARAQNATTTQPLAYKGPSSPSVESASAAGGEYGGGGNNCRACPCYPVTTTKIRIETCYVTVTAPCTAR